MAVSPGVGGGDGTASSSNVVTTEKSFDTFMNEV